MAKDAGVSGGEQPVKRVVGKPFVKGQSGNPGGYPKALAELKLICQSHAPAAIAALVLALDDPKTRVPAATVLLDRGFGRPAQPIDGDGDGGPVQITYKWAAPDA